jgi:hypothetical protein
VATRREPQAAAVKTVFLASDDPKIRKEAGKVAAQLAVRFLQNPPAPPRTIGVFTGRALKDALDILALVSEASHPPLHACALRLRHPPFASILLPQSKRDVYGPNQLASSR